MATRKQFADEMNRMYENHGVYVGGCNGELTKDLTIGKIYEKEKDYGRRDSQGNPLWYTDTARDLEYIAKCYRNKYNMEESQSADCSGAEVSALRKLGIIKSTADYNCRSFIKVCKERGKIVPLKNLQPSDLVFNKEEEPTHMGTYVGDGMVVEFKGRDAGCVRRKTSEGGWAVGGRLPDDWFDGDDMVLKRVLKYIPEDMMQGNDVKQVQMQLQLAGYTPGAADGVFGKKTKIAVQAFQLDNKLTADGIVGKNTAEALGFKWEG